MTLLLGVALADAIPIGFDDCPRGSFNRNTHSGTWCEPTTCTDDSDCGSAQVCSLDAIALCTETQTVPCGGRGGFGTGCTETRTTVHHPCGANDGCALGTCETVRRCADQRTDVKVPSTPKGCQTSALGGLLLALAGLFGRRRD